MDEVTFQQWKGLMDLWAICYKEIAALSADIMEIYGFLAVIDSQNRGEIMKLRKSMESRFQHLKEIKKELDDDPAFG